MYDVCLTCTVQSTNEYKNQSVYDTSLSDFNIYDAPAAEYADQTFVTCNIKQHCFVIVIVIISITLSKVLSIVMHCSKQEQEPIQRYVEVSVARLKLMYIIGGVLTVVTVILTIIIGVLASRSCAALSAPTAITSTPATTIRCACPAASSTTQASMQTTTVSGSLAMDTSQTVVHSIDVVTPAEIHKYPNSCRTAEPNGRYCFCSLTSS